MIYFVSAKNGVGNFATKFGFAKDHESCSARISNAVKLLAANGFYEVVGSDYAEGSKKQEQHIHSRLRQEFTMFTSGGHKDGFTEAYHGLSDRELFSYLVDVGLGFSGIEPAEYKFSIWIEIEKQETATKTCLVVTIVSLLGSLGYILLKY